MISLRKTVEMYTCMEYKAISKIVTRHILVLKNQLDYKLLTLFIYVISSFATTLQITNKNR